MTKTELLKWEATPNATSYTVKLKNIDTGESFSVEVGNKTELEYTFTSAGKYSWIVIAKNAVISADASKRRTIIVVEPIKPTQLISPDNGAVVVLEEEAVPPFTGHTTNIQVPTNISGSTWEFDVTVDNFVSVGAISLTLNYDNSIIAIKNIIPNIEGMLTNDLGYQLRAAWIAYNESEALSLPPNHVLFTVEFELLGTTETQTTFDWSDTNGECEYAGYGGTPIYFEAEFNDLAWTLPV